MNSIVEHDKIVKRKLQKIKTKYIVSKEIKDVKKSLFTKVKQYYRQRSISLPIVNIL